MRVEGGGGEVSLCDTGVDRIGYSSAQVIALSVTFCAVFLIQSVCTCARSYAVCNGLPVRMSGDL
jgi:hypothetical protein